MNFVARSATLAIRPVRHAANRTGPSCTRWQSTNNPDHASSKVASLSPRWLADVKQRIGKCLTFGATSQQTTRAGRILSELAHDWRELVAGSEGFLTGPERRGMHRQEVVWGEMDSMGHVNNVMYNRYAESGRIQWTQKLAMLDPEHRKAWQTLFAPTEAGLILRTITTEFKFPMKWPDHISIYHKLRNEPTEGMDAFILDVLIMSELHQRPAARLIEDVLVYDYTKAKKIALPGFMFEVFQKTWRLQEEAKECNSLRVNALLESVRSLECETWDRHDAKEDFGGSKP
jgi:acyl-CoA thioesterase FadM